MTAGELKAYIEGMGVEIHPTQGQWERLLKKVEELNCATPNVGWGTGPGQRVPYTSVGTGTGIPRGDGTWSS